MISEALSELIDGRDLSEPMAKEIAQEVMQGRCTPAQIASLLTALRIKGETVAEVAAFGSAMRHQAFRIAHDGVPLLDTCGTGGSPCKTFNVSTCVSLLLASMGVRVAKHGNRAASGKCGSADVLEALGVRLDLSPEDAGACLSEAGVVFLFAQSFHPAMKAIGPIRRELGFRTLFNLMGPLANPAGADHQIMGVYSPELCDLAAGVLGKLGSKRALVVHGEPGMDEVSTVGETRASEWNGERVISRTLSRRDFGLSSSDAPEIASLAPADEIEGNARIVREVLGGQQGTSAQSARLELVAANAAAAVWIMGRADDLKAGYEMASAQLASGAALQTLEKLIRVSSSKSGATEAK